MDLNTLKDLEVEIGKYIPGFSVKFKDQTFSQKLLGFLAYPFNRDFMTRYTTTVYPIVYFPTKDYYESQPRSSVTTLAHEFVHLRDMQANPHWFRLSYILPQLLGILPLIVFGILAWSHTWILGILVGSYLLGCLVAKKSLGLFWCATVGGIVAAGVLAVLLTGWHSAAFFGGLALLAPWPAPWRTKWELRGYTMNMAIMAWTYKGVPDIVKKSFLKKFITSAYYFMSWEHTSMLAKLDVAADSAVRGELATQDTYAIVYKFLKDHGEF